jgi:hypothetical protein
MIEKLDHKKYGQYIEKITELNSRKLKAKAEMARVNVELAEIKEQLLKAGAIEQLGPDFFVNSIACW